MILSRDAIDKAEDIKTREVAVPEWGGAVLMRTPTGTERDAFEASVAGGDKDARKLHNIRARMVAMCLCDAEGKRLYTDAEAVTLGKRSAPVLDRLFVVAKELTGISDEAVEDLAKNSESGLSAADGSN